MISFIVGLLIVAPLLWWILVLWKYKSVNNVPGPQPLPILGNATHIGYGPQDLLNNLSKWAKQYGGIYKIYIANEFRLVITNPDILEQIFSSNRHITKSNAYDLLKGWLGTGLLTSTGAKWKSRRKLLTPAFHFKVLDQFIEVFNSCGNILVDKLSKEAGKESVNVHPFINLCSLDLICETAMGVKILAQEGGNRRYVDAVQNFLDIFIVRTFSSWKRLDGLFKFTKTYVAYKKNLKIMHDFTTDIIIKRRKEKSQTLVAESTDDGVKKKVALLDMLLECEDNNMLPNEDIREEIDTFLFEGHDTTTSGIDFAIFSLGSNPEIQEKLYDEIISITGNGQTTNLTMQQLQEAKYLEMVIKETQRMYPSVPIIERILETDCNICGYNMPKDAFLALFIYGIHHNEKYFPDPEKYDPDRFLPENQSRSRNYAYVPFSAGPRNCIGQKFAMLAMKVILAKIVKKFRILQVPNYKPDLGATAVLKSYNGVYVRLEHR